MADKKAAPDGKDVETKQSHFGGKTNANMLKLGRGLAKVAAQKKGK